MKSNVWLGAALVVTLVSAGPASAQTYGPNGSYNGGPTVHNGDRDDAPRSGNRFIATVRSLDLSGDQRRQIRDIERDVNGNDARDTNRRILAVLNDDQRRELFARLRDGGDTANANVTADRNDRYDNGNRDGDRYGNQQDRSARSGVVASFNAFDLNLRNGQYIRLHQGTIINPTGTTLRPGQHVTVNGHLDSNGTLEADRIDVIPGGRYVRAY